MEWFLEGLKGRAGQGVWLPEDVEGRAGGEAWLLKGVEERARGVLWLLQGVEGRAGLGVEVRAGGCVLESQGMRPAIHL